MMLIHSLLIVILFSIAGCASGESAYRTSSKVVTLVGSLQKELGGKSNWDPADPATEMVEVEKGLFCYEGSIHKGSYLYKVAINRSWKENYGVGGTRSGKNIELRVVRPVEKVKFCYSDLENRIADSTRYTFIDSQQRPRLKNGEFLNDYDFDNFWNGKVELKKGANIVEIKYDNFLFKSRPVNVSKDVAGNVFFDSRTKQVLVDDVQFDKSYLFHDTFDRDFRTPFESIPLGSSAKLRIKIKDGFAKDVRLLVEKYELRQNSRRYLLGSFIEPMKLVRSKDGYEFWEAEFKPTEIGLYGYKFVVNSIYQYGDDDYIGGKGRSCFDGETFILTVYDPAFKTPEWFKKGNLYFLMVDRFYNGDKNNDHAKTSARGDIPITIREWDDLPANKKPHDNDDYSGNDYFGGDLAGLIQKLDYLKSIGVDIIYTMPIFLSSSNDKYDIGDYKKIDPMLGNDDVFKQLISEMDKRGMSLVLDGVFNHVGDDSIYFDRYNKYPWIGAYEYWEKVYQKVDAGVSMDDAKKKAMDELLQSGQKVGPYNWHNWFDIENRIVSPRDGNIQTDHYMYRSWIGYSYLPTFAEPAGDGNDISSFGQSELNLDGFANYFIYDRDAVVKYWPARGTSGWRLDVVSDIDTRFWHGFRKELKSGKFKKEPVLVGEVIPDASYYLLGDSFDSVMNYRFRRAVLKEFLLGKDGKLASLILRSLQQNYPLEAQKAMMNILSSQDVDRAIYLLGDGTASTHMIAQKDDNFDYQKGVSLFKLGAMIQYTYLGVPSTYYGDEVGLFGAKDPDNRRSFPWGKEDLDLYQWVKKLSEIRKEYLPILTDGSLALLDLPEKLFGFVRELNEDKIIVLASRDSKEITIQLAEFIKQYDKYDVSVLFGECRLENDGALRLDSNSGVVLRMTKR